MLDNTKQTFMYIYNRLYPLILSKSVSKSCLLKNYIKTLFEVLLISLVCNYFNILLSLKYNNTLFIKPLLTCYGQKVFLNDKNKIQHFFVSNY